MRAFIFVNVQRKIQVLYWHHQRKPPVVKRKQQNKKQNRKLGVIQMSATTITLLFLLFAVIMFVLEKIPLGVTSMIVCIGLVVTGVLDIKTAFAGFIDSNVILFVAMFIVGGALFETGMANKIGGIVTKFAKTERMLIVAIMVIVGFMSGVLSNTGTAAVLIPVVIGIAARSGYKRSRLLTQPAISNAIKELEKEYSINLFIRSKNHMSLTKEGEIFYQKANHLLTQFRQTTSELYDLGKQKPSLRIGIPPLLSTIFFPDLLLFFRREYPDIPVILSEYGSMRAADLVQEEVLDLALVNMHFYNIDKMNTLRMQQDHIVFCVSKERPLAKEKEVTVEMLKEEPLILYNTDSVLNKTLLALFENAGLKPNILLYASQLYTIRSFVLNNLGGAFLYSSLLKNDRNLVKIPVVPLIYQDIGLVWKKGKYLNNSVEAFLSFAGTQVKDS